MSISELFHPNYYNIYANRITTNINNIQRSVFQPIASSFINCSLFGGGGEYFSIGTFVSSNMILVIDITNPAINASLEIEIPFPRQDGNFPDSLRSVGFGTFKDSSPTTLYSIIFIESVAASQRIKIQLAPIPGGMTPFQLAFQFSYEGSDNPSFM